MRTRILELLRQHAGHYVSGEEISKQLAVSRTAVWKHIQALKNAGYDIEAHSRLGYSLRQAPDLLLPAEIAARLKTTVFGKEIRYFAEIGSTNNEAKRLAAEGCPEGLIVVAEAQNTGRGRLARGWFSPFGKGIWLSVVLRPSFHPLDAPKCTLMAAVALTKAIHKVTDAPCGIKWPNDILYEGKKLVGILTEMSAEMDAINYVVIGMGINVNIAPDEFPPELRDIATSVAAAAGRPVSRLALLAEVLAELETVYCLAVSQGFDPVLDEWRKLSITLGQQVNVLAPGETFTGIAVNIDNEGALLVDTGQGVRRVLAGDVSIRPPT
ncbi:biotin--[acetyl-CoA-carboxylase] ligase [Sporolituus thermophilus]|uniref:Bifunctional ligase/repressor BirA n=1 Tax=Sporolituus thermophilus DSM 23256 TaxID=1123285 RepID=A0A1G7IXF0_9FIRM|nr:biotin--[acetyl-CoA-carboxylase] ligase [Sporolituus thermophilus]SDF17333.1 BirA family transcriptional regulator, biotin operon repressor / biotin-[acetyl-CoA-carboxylase] ligase [Sporolituus thermophilus DSM 23256]